LTLQFVYDGAEQGNTVIRLTEGIQSLPAVAHGGEVSFAGVTIEDPAGTLDFKAWQPCYFEETACTGRTRIWTGFVASRSISRGKYRNGAGRIWDMTLVDQNAVFSLLPITGNTFNRPAETDIARLAFVTGSTNLPDTLIGENGKANFTDNPVSFGEADYRHQFPLDMFTSVAGTAGKDFYAYFDHTAGETSLFYDLNAVTLSTSTLRISNVAADYDGTTTFAPLKDAVLTRSGEDVYSNIDYQYRGGFVVDEDAQTISDFIKRGAIYSTDRVGRRETAVALAQAFLDAHDEETDELAVSVRLPKAKVNLIEQGMGLDVKFSHLPGYSADFVETKIISRNVRQYDDEWYDLDLVCSLKPLLAGPGGGDPGDFPQLTCDSGTGTLVQVGATAYNVSDLVSPTLSSTPTVGNTLVLFMTFQDAANNTSYVPSGWTAATPMASDNDVEIGSTDGRGVRLFYRTVLSGDGTSWQFDADTGGTRYTTASIAEFTGPLEAISSDTEEQTADQGGGVGATFEVPCGSVTPTAGTPMVAIAAGVAGDQQAGIVSALSPIWNVGTALTDVEGADINVAAWAYLQDASPSGAAVTMEWSNDHDAGLIHGTGGVIALFQCSGSTDDPPAPGQWVLGETPTPTTGGGNRVFFTAHPYADGSLRVWVDDIDQTAAVTESDPETGEFTLAFDPTSTETIRVDYQGR
jgi:hypothetical protein